MKKELHILYVIANPRYFHSTQDIHTAATNSITTWAHKSEIESITGNATEWLNSTRVRTGNGTSAAPTSAPNSLLQTDDGQPAHVSAHLPKPSMATVQAARELVQTTKTLAEDAAACMAHAPDSLAQVTMDALGT